MFRKNGVKTVAAFDLFAPELDMSARKARTLFERDRAPIIAVNEWRRILAGAIQVRRHMSLALRARCDRWDEETALLELRQQQLELWGPESGEAQCKSQTSGCDDVSQKLAA
jgi:hypothetical protein